MNRRSFLGGLFAAPAIVAVGNIMPVKLIDWATPVRGRLVSWGTYYVRGTWPNHHLLPRPNFTTIQEAMDAIRDDGVDTATVHIAPGVHYGPCVVPVGVESVMLKGDPISPPVLRDFYPTTA